MTTLSTTSIMSSHPTPDASAEPPAKRIRLSDTDTTSSTKHAGKIGQCSESDVGITEYVIYDVPGFSGILKQRYTDFLVNEIDLEGNVLRLQNLQPKKEVKEDVKPKEKQVIIKPQTNDNSVKAVDTSAKVEDVPEIVPTQPEQAALEDNGVAEPFKLDDTDSALLISALSSSLTETLVALHNEILAIERAIKAGSKRVNTPDAKLVTSTSIEDKEIRSMVHQTIRRVFDNKFLSETNSDNNIVIWAKRISTSNGSKQRGPKNFQDSRNDENRRSTLSFKEMGGDYLHFNLYKENKDTMECISLLARFLKIHSKLLTYAGTKDRRGVTVQRLCAIRIRAERLAGLNRNLKGMRLGDFEYKPQQLRLGDLKGNEFCISLRDCDLSEAGETGVEEAVTNLRNNGFINYYGLQRFGTFSTGTHIVGRHLMQSDWQGAVEKIMSYDDPLPIMASQDERERAAAIKKWNDGQKSANASEVALKMMPRRYLGESAILRYLSQDRNQYNWLESFQQVPRGLRLMFVHAYQSYIWNCVVSERMKLWGMKLHPGDLVIIPENEIAANKPILDEEEEEIGMDKDADEDFIRARPITAEEAASGVFTMYDLVMPTAGWDIVYPDNEMKDVYVELMKQDGLDPFDLSRPQKETSLAGHYRRVLHKPDFVDYEIKTYSHDNEQLIETDLEWVQAANKRKDQKQVGSKSDKNGSESTNGGSKEGSKKAVIVKLRLGTSQYATMALRELMKGGTRTFTAVFDDSRKTVETKSEDVVMEG